VDLKILEDDWPFPYLRRPGIPKEYLFAMLLIALVSVLAVCLAGGRRDHRIKWHFFGLGAGFLLLETRGVTVLALHVGSTWGVSAAVFAGVLAMSLLATGIGARLMSVGAAANVRHVFYVLLFVALTLDFVTPMRLLSAQPLSGRVAIGAFLVALPMLASGTVFALSLSREPAAQEALGSNLIGAMCGGLVEYTSMASGFQYLLVLAAGFYALAWLFDLKEREGAGKVEGRGLLRQPRSRDRQASAR
jgi:hypothetical protein